MNNERQDKGMIHHLPLERVDWLTEPIARFLRVETVAGTVLLFFTIAGDIGAILVVAIGYGSNKGFWQHRFFSAVAGIALLAGWTRYISKQQSVI